MTKNAHAEADEKIQVLALCSVVGFAGRLLALATAKCDSAAIGTTDWSNKPRSILMQL